MRNKDYSGPNVPLVFSSPKSHTRALGEWSVLQSLLCQGERKRARLSHKVLGKLLPKFPFDWRPVLAGMISSEQDRSLVKHLCWVWFFPACSSHFQVAPLKCLQENPWEPHSGSCGSISSLGGFFSEAQKAKATPRYSECSLEFLSLCFSKDSPKISK